MGTWLRRHTTIAWAAIVAILAVAVACGAAGYLGWSWPAGYGATALLTALVLFVVGGTLTGVATPETTARNLHAGSLFTTAQGPDTSDGFGFKRLSDSLVVAALAVALVGFALLGLAAAF